MEQYIETRAKIKKDHPDLLMSMREKITQQMRAGGASEPVMNVAGDEKIDRRKNLQTVEKVLNLKAASPDFQEKLKKMILAAQP